MEFFPTSTILGTLEVLEIYIQYNGARLLACKNQANKIFVALWVDEEEEYDLWLYMLVSLDRLQSIRTGAISLHQAFCEAENSCLYELTYSYVNSQWSTQEIALEDLDKDYLPLEDTFLECDPETLPQVSSQKIIQNAILEKREFVNLILQPPSNRYPNEFPIFELGSILATYQPLINELNISKKMPTGANSKEIAKKSEYNARAFKQGSFQVELASSFFETDIFGNSIAGDATEQFFELLTIGSNINDLENSILKNNKKIARRYIAFLESLISSESGFKIEWGSPTISRGGSLEVSLSSLHETLEEINRMESLEIHQFEVVGDLFKADKDGWKFGISELITKKHYKGDILEEAKSDARIARISGKYKALIREVSEINPTTNATKIQYKLLALTAYQDSNEQLEILGN